MDKKILGCLGSRMRPFFGCRNGMVALVVAVSFLLYSEGLADYVDSNTARLVVKGWLASHPDGAMGAKLGNEVLRVESYFDPRGSSDNEPVYYVVFLRPAGFVIVSADDWVEPIIGFGSGADFRPVERNNMWILATVDMANRKIAAKRKRADMLLKGEMDPGNRYLKNMTKWQDLISVAVGDAIQKGVSSVSDVFVYPLLESTWGQSTVGSTNCYNYFTPSNYVCGCVATAMAQIMRYHQYPTAGVGTNSFEVEVDDYARTLSLRGGNGAGGPYDWSSMVLQPGSDITDTQCQAIGALCYDAGVSVGMSYSSSSSGAYICDDDEGDPSAGKAFTNVFMYGTCMKGQSSVYYQSIDTNQFASMINASLDAKLPVLLGIYWYYANGHAIVCDGYGFDSDVMYHHLNMGWSGEDDAWYALPLIVGEYADFNVLSVILYNISMSTNAAQIIGGKVRSSSGRPMSGIAVTATSSDGSHVYTGQSDTNGTYAIVGVAKNTDYTLTFTHPSLFLGSLSVSVGESDDYTEYTGNSWSNVVSARDSLYPLVYIESPSSGDSYSTSNSTVTLAGTYYDECAVTEITWRNNAGSSGTCKKTSSNEWVAAGISLASGANVITVTAYNSITNFSDSLTVTYTAPVVQTAVKALNDFDGDGKSDMAVYNPLSGDWYIYSAAGSIIAYGENWGLAGPVADYNETREDVTYLVAGDYNGNGCTDMGVFIKSTDEWYVKSIGDGTIVAWSLEWGSTGETAVPGDYDGDGKTDFAVFEPANGLWKIWTWRGDRFQIQFGWSETVPVPGDYDGDRITDFGVYHPASGTWYIWTWNGGYYVQQFGWASAEPVQADYDGDGKMDFAVYDPEQANWHILTWNNVYYSRQFGWSETEPVQGDYDGDGKVDLAVYYPEGGMWYIWTWLGAVTSVQWGWSDAVPVPAGW